MSTPEIVVLVLVLLVVAAIAAALVAQSRKRKRLQSTFGPEYERTVQSSGRRREAERELAEREQRRQSLDIRPLPAQDRQQFGERWHETQADFVDRPEEAVRAADRLVTEVMGRRGYPMGDFEQMSRDVSVDHAQVVSDYRAAHEISELNDRKAATTEQLRQAMVHYRALFTDLLSDADDDSRGPDAVQDRAPVRPTTYDTDRDSGTTNDLHDGSYEGAHHADGGRGDVGYATTEDHEHTRSFDDARTRDERVTSDGAATDGVRTERSSTDRIDTSRADGVRVEPGGLRRNELEDRDRPRA